VLLVTLNVKHVNLMIFVSLVLVSEKMLQTVLVQMVNGTIITSVKIVIINVEFVTTVLPIVVEKVNVLRIESIHQHVTVTLVTMMTDITLLVTFVTVNVQIVHKLDVLLAQV